MHQNMTNEDMEGILVIFRVFRCSLPDAPALSLMWIQSLHTVFKPPRQMETTSTSKRLKQLTILHPPQIRPALKLFGWGAVPAAAGRSTEQVSAKSENTL
jgi:hypothetical protein